MSCYITIFEGPDGSGKSTAAKAFAEATGARLVHCGPYLGVEDLVPVYFDAMRPALYELSPVVMDRSWLSERPYGEVYRGGADRLGPPGRQLLDYVAVYADAQVVLCLPPVDVCLRSYRMRRGDEMLKNEEQLRKVHELYFKYRHDTVLPITGYDYTAGDTVEELLKKLEADR